MRIRAGTTALYRWEAPEPVASVPAPALSIRAGGALVAGLPALEPVAPPVGITSIARDRRALSVAAALDAGEAAGAAGPDWGSAWLVAPGGGVYPVRVSSIIPAEGGATVYLADPLPHTVPAAGASIQWATWTALLTPATVTATPRADIVWSVAFTPIHAGAATDDAARLVDEGRIVVVRAPFDTGLTPDDLGDAFPSLRQTVASGDNGRGGIIDRARAVLELLIRPHVRARGLDVSDLDGEDFSPAHASLAASIALAGTDPERAEALRTEAGELVDLALRATWADRDRDGVPEAGETGTELHGPPRSSRRGAGPSPRARFWVGMPH